MTATTFHSLGYAARPRDAANKMGKIMLSAFPRFVVTSASSAIGDLYVLGGPYSMDDKVQALIGNLPAFTSATSCDLGFYQLNADGNFTTLGGTAGNATALWSAVDLSSATTYRELLLDKNTSLDSTKNIGDLCSLTCESEPVGGIFVVLRFNVANTATSVQFNTELVVEKATTH